VYLGGVCQGLKGGLSPPIHPTAIDIYENLTSGSIQNENLRIRLFNQAITLSSIQILSRADSHGCIYRRSPQAHDLL
jgi:hypothetical protein